MYPQRYLPDHPRADYTGYVSEHILIMEELLGRPLRDGEVVHHKDFNKWNNLPTNLLLTDRKEHQNLPALQAKFLLARGLYGEFLEWYKQWGTSKEAEIENTQKALAEIKIRLEKLERRRRRNGLSDDIRKGRTTT